MIVSAMVLSVCYFVRLELRRSFVSHSSKTIARFRPHLLAVAMQVTCLPNALADPFRSCLLTNPWEPKWCSVPCIGVIGKSAFEIGQLLRRNFWMLSGGPFFPFSPGPFFLLLIEPAEHCGCHDSWDLWELHVVAVTFMNSGHGQNCICKTICPQINCGLCDGSVPTTPDPNASAKASRYKWRLHRDTTRWCVCVSSFLSRGGHAFAKTSW